MPNHSCQLSRLYAVTLLLALSATACNSPEVAPMAPQANEQLGVRDRAEIIRARETDALIAATTLDNKISHAVKYFETVQFNATRDEAEAVVFLEEFFQLVIGNFTSFGLITVQPELQGVQTLMALASAMDETGRRNATSVLELIEEALRLPRNAEPTAYQRVILESREYAAYLLHLRYNVMAHRALVALDPQSLDLPRRALFPHRIGLYDVSLNTIRDCTQWIREAMRMRGVLSQLRLRRSSLNTPLSRRYKRLYLSASPGNSPRARAERALVEAFNPFVEPMRPDQTDTTD
jgi:hypothetical protein